MVRNLEITEQSQLLVSPYGFNTVSSSKTGRIKKITYWKNVLA